MLDTRMCWNCFWVSKDSTGWENNLKCLENLLKSLFISSGGFDYLDLAGIHLANSFGWFRCIISSFDTSLKFSCFNFNTGGVFFMQFILEAVSQRGRVMTVAQWVDRNRHPEQYPGLSDPSSCIKEKGWKIPASGLQSKALPQCSTRQPAARWIQLCVCADIWW